MEILPWFTMAFPTYPPTIAEFWVLPKEPRWCCKEHHPRKRRRLLVLVFLARMFQTVNFSLQKNLTYPTLGKKENHLQKCLVDGICKFPGRVINPYPCHSRNMQPSNKRLEKSPTFHGDFTRFLTFSLEVARLSQLPIVALQGCRSVAMLRRLGENVTLAGFEIEYSVPNSTESCNFTSCRSLQVFKNSTKLKST